MLSIVKRSILKTFQIALVPIVFLALSAALSWAQTGVSIAFGTSGLSSLKYNGTDFLLYGDLRLDQVTFTNSNGSTFAGAITSTVTVDPVSQTQTRIYNWGKILVSYSATGNQLNVAVTVTNSSAQPIQQIWFEALGLRFPSAVTNYDGSDPIIYDTLGQPAVALLQSASAAVAIAADDVAKPLQLGVPFAFDRPANTQFPVDLNTGTVASYPNSFPVINRSIPAGGSDQFRFSLRFGPSGSTATTLAADVYRNYAATFAPTLNWTDRRAIGQLILATSAAGYPTNPRGWLLDSTIDVTTPAGVAAFQQRVLSYAANSIAILKQMNAQGMVTWDIEGEQFAQPTSYIGDPRVFATLAPEMAGVADQYFQAFRSAGFRVGVCIRPQQLQIAAGNTSAQQIPLADPTQTLIDKATYAHTRWGATLFYIDSNVNATDPNPIDPAIIRALSAALPDSLFIPEHSSTQYYAYSAPYRELRQGYTTTPPDARVTYPKAFTVINTADGPIAQNFNALVTAVQGGDILLYRSWFADPQNAQVLSIYQTAGGTSPAISISVNPVSASLNAGQSQQFISSATGSTNSQVNWTISPAGVGTISTTGLYSAPATLASAQSVSVIATSAADATKSGSATVNITPVAPVTVSVTPTAASIVAGQTQQFLASVANSANTQVIWSISPAGVGTISTTGLYTAPATLTLEQAVLITATSSASPTKSATATLTVTVPAPITINVTPASSTINSGQTQQFTATVGGTTNTGVSWAISPAGVGVISSSGLYSAPQSIVSSQTVTITATSVANAAKSASAAVTLTPAAVVASCGAPATGAFTGCYYSDRSFAQLAFSRNDPQINFVWTGTGPGSGVQATQYAVRWQGNFTFSAGTYQFIMASDDGSRLYVDGQQIIDAWSEHPAIPVTVSIPLTAGTHLIRMDYFQLDGSAVANLSWNLTGAAIPVAISVSPTTASLTAGQSQQFSATVTGASNQQVTWAVSPAGFGSISAAGLFTANASLASQTVVAITATSVADPTKSASASLTLRPVVVAPVAIAVVVNPQTVSVISGQLQPFAASVTGTTNTQVNWSISPANLGSISAAGIYSAPVVTSSQAVTVTATSAADPTKFASAIATVTPVAASCGAPATNAFTGCYYSERSFDPSYFSFTRVDPQINFVWNGTSPGGALRQSDFQIRWQGNFSFTGGNYTFTATTDDGSRLYIDGQLIIDYWGEHPAIPTSKIVALTPGSHLIQFEYMQLTGAAVANLAWTAAQ